MKPATEAAQLVKDVVIGHNVRPRELMHAGRVRPIHSSRLEVWDDRAGRRLSVEF